MFGVHIAEHCNLNCAHCSHFSPLADKILMPVEDFRRDVERMGELFNHECERFQIYGGEPLLLPESITLVEFNCVDYSLMKFSTMHIDLSGKSDGRKNFYGCSDANKCVILGYGKLYTCLLAYTIRHFNKMSKWV